MRLFVRSSCGSAVDRLPASFKVVAALPPLVGFCVVAAAAIVARTTVALYLHARRRLSRRERTHRVASAIWFRGRYGLRFERRRHGTDNFTLEHRLGIEVDFLL